MVSWSLKWTKHFGNYYSASNLAATTRCLDGLLPADGSRAWSHHNRNRIHPDKIEAVARPAESEDVLGKIDSAIENANKYVEKVVLPRRRQADPDVKSGEADERQKLQAALDQFAESCPNQNTPKMRVPSDRTYSGEQHAKKYHLMARAIPMSLDTPARR